MQAALPSGPRTRRLAVALVVATGLAVGSAQGVAARVSKTGTATPPTISIGSPTAGSTLSATVTVSGAAADKVGLASVQVHVDSGPSSTASGTSAWTWSLGTASLTNGSHTITAVATDTSGLTATASVAVTVSNSTTWTAGGLTVTDSVITNPATTDPLLLVDRGVEASWGTVSATLYRTAYSWQYYLYLRDSSSGATSTVLLPGSTSSLLGNYAHAVLNGLGDYWVFGGGGPVTAVEWKLSGSPLPTSATLAGTTTWGDSDSRAGGLLRLASGGLVGVWRQQGATGPQGMGIAYRSPSGAWSSIYPLQFMPTASSKQALAQNPADGSIWIFNDPDAYAAIGAVHLTEGPSGITVDWTNPSFIDDSHFGGNGPDPENPDLEAVPDPATGTVVLAYQSQTRQVFSTSPWVVGSYPVVARIGTTGSMSFLVLPTYVERITTLGLVVQSGQTWLMYRPVDPSTLTWNRITVSRYAAGAWTGPAVLGTASDSYEVLDYGAGAPEFDAVLSDGQLHQLRASAN